MIPIRVPRALAAFVVAAAAFGPAAAAAQEPPDELTPRALADSTYAVRVALDALAESIRHGGLDLRQRPDPELAAAVNRLAAAGRNRQPPHADLGVLWDFRIEVDGFQPVGQDVLRAQVRAFLATKGDSTSAPVMLTFQRRGDRWNLTAHEGFTARLAQMAVVLGGGTGP